MIERSRHIVIELIDVFERSHRQGRRVETNNRIILRFKSIHPHGKQSDGHRHTHRRQSLPFLPHTLDCAARIAKETSSAFQGPSPHATTTALRNLVEASSRVGKSRKTVGV